MKVLVTGASGHLGYHICKILTAEFEEYNVKAFIRNSSYKKHLEKLPVDIHYGNVLEINSIKKAMEGVDAVFHTAAVYRMSENERDNEGKDPIIKTSVEGTKNLYNAASEKNINKIVFTSSVATIGSTIDKNKPLDESSFTNNAFNDYYKAKIESEKLAFSLSEKLKIPTVICNPSTIIGKDDYKLTPSNRMLLDMVKKNMFYVDGGQSLVDVEDVSRGHVLALENGKENNRYILGGENIEIREIMVQIRKILNIRGPLLKLNKSLLFSAAYIFDCMEKLAGIKPVITREKISRAVNNYSYFDHSKSRNELGYTPKKISETLQVTLRWLLKNHGSIIGADNDKKF